ncbi:MAG: hypothetical protein J6Y58_04625 [Clostridiales bacterium]|nr:hypothetical protein [Clostridiales bacterium]
MILQRDCACAVFGKDDQVSEVSLILEGKEYTATVNDGQFLIRLDPHDAATGLSMSIKGSTDIEIRDICFGDVFYLGGQSNMELPVSRTLDVSEEEVKNSNYPYIRQYRVTPQYNMAEDEVAELADNPWVPAVPGKIGELSAAGFYCARRLYDKKKIPIGLVLGAQGGSTIESWMDVSLLSEFGDYESQMKPFMEKNALTNYLKAREDGIASWRQALEREDEEKYISSIPKEASDFTVPGMLLKREGTDHTGIVWFYKEFELKEEPEEDAFLYLGNLIDADQTFINGKAVGRIEYRYPPRKYPFDGSILRKGMNLISVRLLIETGEGGFVAEHPYYIRSGKEKVELTGTWKMVKGVSSETPVPSFKMGQEVPTSLFKTSVRPLKDFTFSGIWWYQGESNAEEPERYGEKFLAMMNYWRDLYQQKLPVIVVEMCDYMDPITCEETEGWASIQAQQVAAAKEVKDCAVVSAKDLGAPLELHPQRKSELGARMAEVAEKMFY